tara:strand:+ start:1636 stop:2070 length:435 start_codon:yes stop_codon:yes gene_type:complete
MAEQCNNQEARELYSTKGNSFKVPVTSVTIIAKIINTLINLPNLPKPPIPRGLITIGNMFKSGINSASMTAKLLQKKQQYGLPTEPLPSGEENKDNLHDLAISETITEELIANAKVVGENSNLIITSTGGVIKPGDIKIVSVIT